jgi:hypothetical protein
VEDAARHAGGPRAHIPIDASVDLPMDNPIAEVGAGDLMANSRRWRRSNRSS